MIAVCAPVPIAFIDAFRFWLLRLIENRDPTPGFLAVVLAFFWAVLYPLWFCVRCGEALVEWERRGPSASRKGRAAARLLGVRHR